MKKNILKLQSGVYRNILIFLGLFGLVFAAGCGANKEKEMQAKNDSIAAAKKKSDSVARADSTVKAQQAIEMAIINIVTVLSHKLCGQFTITTVN
jgi:hypothetical protein